MDIVCYSHLRWNFVYQRPQHILSRLARHFRVIFIEEPVFDASGPYLDNQQNDDKIFVVVPHLPPDASVEESVEIQNKLLEDFLSFFEVSQFIAWYYTPMAIELNPTFIPSLVVYDCMDELSAFKNAPPALVQNEEKLMRRADIVFTGGESLYQAKKHRHLNISCFPSSIDRIHFGKARSLNVGLTDQQEIPSPRIGFFGVVDERMDLQLLNDMAQLRPLWHFIVIGPVVKIDPATLPDRSNIHFLGARTYKELPYYIAKWDVAMMPFAINESTRFISPTKTPEYLAAGKPVVSTPVQDVVNSYGKTGLVYIAETAEQFVAAIQNALDLPNRSGWLKAVDAVLSQNSWDITVEKMLMYINLELEYKSRKKPEQKEDAYV